MDLGSNINLSTIVFLGDWAENSNNFASMTRTYGTNPSRTDTATNKVITQSGGTNYPFMVADVNEGGPASIRYIHWRGTVTFKVSEVLCYEKKRLYPDQISTSKSYWTAQNGPILATDCYTESSEFTDYNYNGN